MYTTAGIAITTRCILCARVKARLDGRDLHLSCARDQWQRWEQIVIRQISDLVMLQPGAKFTSDEMRDRHIRCWHIGSLTGLAALILFSCDCDLTSHSARGKGSGTGGM